MNAASLLPPSAFLQQVVKNQVFPEVPINQQFQSNRIAASGITHDTAYPRTNVIGALDAANKTNIDKLEEDLKLAKCEIDSLKQLLAIQERAVSGGGSSDGGGASKFANERNLAEKWRKKVLSLLIEKGSNELSWNSQLGNVTRQLEQVREDRAKLTAHLKVLECQNKQLCHDLDRSQSENSLLQMQCETAKSALLTNQDALSCAHAKIQSLFSSAKIALANQNKFADEHAGALNRIDEMQDRIVYLQQRLPGLFALAARRLGQSEHMQTRIGQLERANHSLTRANTDLQRRFDEKSKRYDQLVIDRDALISQMQSELMGSVEKRVAEVCAENEEENVQLRGALEKTGGELRAVSEQCNELQLELDKEKIAMASRLESFGNELDVLSEKLLNQSNARKQFEIETALTKDQMIQDRNEHHIQIESLKKENEKLSVKYSDQISMLEEENRILKNFLEQEGLTGNAADFSNDLFSSKDLKIDNLSYSNAKENEKKDLTDLLEDLAKLSKLVEDQPKNLQIFETDKNPKS